MGFGYGMVLRVLLLVIGVLWCRDVFGRFRSDVAVIRESDDRGHKAVVIFWWILTAGVVLLMLSFAWNLLGNVIEGFRSFG